MIAVVAEVTRLRGDQRRPPQDLIKVHEGRRPCLRVGGGTTDPTKAWDLFCRWTLILAMSEEVVDEADQMAARGRRKSLCAGFSSPTLFLLYRTTSRVRRRKQSLSTGSSPVRKSPSSSLMSGDLSPGTRKYARAYGIRIPKKASSPSRVTAATATKKRSDAVEKILLYQELGKDVPIEIALKRVIVMAQRSDWPACEQALRLENTSTF